MILSKQSLMSDAQSLAIAVGSAYSTNILDLGAPGTPVRSNALGRDIGPGEPIDFLLELNSDVTSGGAGTLQATLQVATDAAFTSPVDVQTTPTYALAKLVKGFKLGMQWIPFGTNLRYARMKYTVATADLTGGTITAAPVYGQQSNH